MVVWTVDVESAYKIAQGSSDELLVSVGLLEVGDIELHAFNLGHGEAVVLVGEVAVFDREGEFAHGDAAAEVEVTVATHGDEGSGERVGVDDDGLAVGDHEATDTADEEFVVVEGETGVASGGVGFEREGVVVKVFLLHVGVLVVDEFFLDPDDTRGLVVGDETVAREGVNHQEGLAHVHAYLVGEGLDGELGAHAA